jgi:hypothetical protein
MKKYWKLLGVIIIIAGIIYYPVLKLYQYLTKQKGEQQIDEERGNANIFIPVFRKKHQHVDSNSHDGEVNMS